MIIFIWESLLCSENALEKMYVYKLYSTVKIENKWPVILWLQCKVKIWLQKEQSTYSSFSKSQEPRAKRSENSLLKFNGFFFRHFLKSLFSPSKHFFLAMIPCSDCFEKLGFRNIKSRIYILMHLVVFYFLQNTKYWSIYY